ncbi:MULTISPECIES: TonB-dependent receptor [unclassified Imperialibacter]|uniref:SusC/RagA family TonB-linked outer membrane protein n=1 Tax=unclassified Imperialibacter TaxID=2629706 RepID=UPI0012553310|nr:MULTISPECIES: TonB-dependent receptor [unclassified Imperialibacter]CAD5267925.1 TonB-dependent receptor [Imperialibacter sp. 75]CAD5280456.1 TonB-dependent receptor [Imperialibacter sp. 89]VVT01421.1 TonB-dependent receptor [Imperialibacter sp. EC-SDR9]
MNEILSKCKRVLWCFPVGLALVVICSGQAIARQDSTVSGTITSVEDGSALPGVNVIVKGTTTGTVTDIDGKYSLRVPSRDAVLVFSAIGFSTTEVTVGSQSQISVGMEVDVKSLSEVVVVGYGTQDKRDVTAAIGSIESDAIVRIPTSNAMEAMKGQIAGVDVLQNGGRPGQNSSITIRGRRSLTASNDPLFVVDGIPMTAGTNSIQDFNPSDIASMEVLKDAAATAIYGSRGSNGVVLITTKRGKPGKTSVTYSSSYAVTQPFRTIPMMNGSEFADLKREGSRVDATGRSGRAAWGDAGSSIPADDAVFIDPVELNSVQNGLSTDWQDLIYQNGSQMNQQVSVNGGTEKTQVSLALSYFKEDGLIEGIDYRRYTARINVDHQINKIFKVGVSSLFSNSTQNWGSGSVISEAVNQTPLGLPYDDNGDLIFLPISDGIRSNPLSELVPGKRIDERKINRVFSSVYAEAQILDGLKYKFLLGQDYQFWERGLFEGQFTNPRKNGTPSASLFNQQSFGYTLENILTYNKSFGDHDLGLTGLQSVAQQDSTQNGMSAIDLPYETAEWYNLGLATISQYGTRYEQYRLLSYMGRVNYSFKGKYLFQASMRWDGSSRLADGNKWNAFPGVSAGWRIKDEAFMSGVRVVSDLKLRASYGKVGNTAVSPYQTQGTLGQSIYDWNNVDARGFQLSSIPNPDLSWEYSETTNIGVDFGLFDNRLSGSFEYYRTSSGTSLLLRRALPPTSGYASILQNIGGTQTNGFEITLNSTILDMSNGLRWTADFNLGSYNEEIVDLAQRDADGNKVDDVGNGWFIGQPIRSFYDYEKIGIWQVSEKDQASALMGAFPGEIKLKDQDGDGTISPANDRIILGNDVPAAYGGLNTRVEFKGFDLSMFFYYRVGFLIQCDFCNGQATMQARYNNLAVDYWTVDNPTNDYPRPNINQENISFGSTLRYTDGGYMKLRNITLGYTLPNSVLDKLKFSTVRIYATAQNPIVWSKFKQFDPERGGNIGSGEMPSNQLFLGGLNISF